MNTALLLIDAQTNMFDPATPVAGAVPLLVRLHELQKRARAVHAPVVFVRNTGAAGEPDEPGTPGWEVQTVLHPAPDWVRPVVAVDRPVISTRSPVGAPTAPAVPG